MLLESAQAAARYARIAQGTVPFESLAALPLMYGDRTLASFSISFRQPRRFDDGDIAFLTAWPGRPSRDQDRARLRQAEQEARAEAQTLHRVAQLSRRGWT